MNPSTAVARRLVNALVEAGVEHVVYCPGSRDAPIGYALADAETAGWLRVYVRLDERSAGFVALGVGRAGCPAALVTTSGTAVANIHPAVLEADAAGVPLIVLSADRPAEMWHTGANQTTVQTGIFGSAPRLSTDVPAGFPADERLDALVLRAVTAATGALSADPGPVHLNVSFRDSLVPDGPWQPQALVPRRVSSFPTAPTPLVMPARTVVVAGDGAGSLARELAQQGGWPLLAEPTSGSRVGDNALTDYQTVLGSELVDDVEAVLVLGHPTLSRPVSRLLARPDVTVVTDRSRWTDVAGVARVVTGPVELAEIDTDPAWLGRWKDADRPVVPTAKQRLCRDIWWACTTPNAPVLVIGASEVIRCFDRFAVPGDIAPTALANRGLAGIDGTIATAIGVGLGTGRPVRVVVGDLTFAHDAMSLLLGETEPEPDVQVVVLDDRGGAIFSGLEHAAAPAPVLRRMFLTPQRLDRFAVPGDIAPTALANRGLAGIDGTIATAIGVGLGTGRPVRVVVGDLTFAHDAMSLLLGETEPEPDVQVVVLDDRGGAIFSGLEHAAAPAPVLRRMFLTPQRLDSAALAHALGASHRRVSPDDLQFLDEPVVGRQVVSVPLT